MAPPNEERDPQEPNLDVRRWNQTIVAVAGITGQEQSRFGPSLALLGCDRLATSQFHLRHVAFHHASVATACTDVMGDFSGSVAGCRHVSPFSATPRWESIQRDSAACIFLCHLRFVPFANRYRNHDVAGAGCAVSLVPQNHGRPSGSAQFALYRSSHLYRFHCRSSDLGNRTWD